MDKPWIDAAMHMREQGKKLQDIADVVGVAPKPSPRRLLK